MRSADSLKLQVQFFLPLPISFLARVPLAKQSRCLQGGISCGGTCLDCIAVIVKPRLFKLSFSFVVHFCCKALENGLKMLICGRSQGGLSHTQTPGFLHLKTCFWCKYQTFSGLLLLCFQLELREQDDGN